MEALKELSKTWTTTSGTAWDLGKIAEADPEGLLQAIQDAKAKVQRYREISWTGNIVQHTSTVLNIKYGGETYQYWKDTHVEPQGYDSRMRSNHKA